MQTLLKAKGFYWGIFGLSLLLAYLQKTPCFSGNWGAPDYVQYRNLCYNDLQALYGYRGLDKRKIPYVEEKKFEYPPLIGFQMYLTGLVTDNNLSFFRANALVNSLWAALAFGVLILCFGYGAHLLWFAAVPPLVFYLHLNWDISSVTVLCLAYFAWHKDRPDLTGAALGVGFTGKMFPLFAVPALVIAIYQDYKDWKREVGKFLLGLCLGWMAMNLPILILDLIKNGDYHAIFTVFGFHTARTPDYGTPWYWIGELFGFGPTTREFTAVVDRVFLVGMALFSSFALWKQYKRQASPWGTAAAITAFCLVISKIHSPQYGIWFLGFYLMLETPWYLVAVYLLADFLVFLNGFWWFTDSPTLQPHFFRTIFISAIAFRAVVLAVLATHWALASKARKPVASH